MMSFGRMGSVVCCCCNDSGSDEPTDLPTARKTYTLYKLTSQQLGGSGATRKNQADMLVQVYNDALFESGFWTCLRSSDGVTVSSSNLWTDWTKLQGLIGGTGMSWIQSRNTVTGVEYLTTITVSGNWLEQITYFSPSAGFTGGTNLTRPTATDEFQTTGPGGADWLGTDASSGLFPNPKFRAWVWVSTDGEVSRVAWTFDTGAGLATTVQAFWMREVLNCPVGGTWVNWLSWDFDNGNGYATPAALMRLQVFNIVPKKVRTNAAVNEDCPVVAEEFGNDYYVDRYPQDQTSLQYLWINPPGVVVGNVAAPRNGMLGWFFDLWFVGSVGGTAPVFPAFDTADGKTKLFVDAMMLPWDGTAVPGAVGSTDHAAANFYGRSIL